MNTLYTYGYTGGSVEDLKRYADDGALILDTRLIPFSRWHAHWRRPELEALLGDAYSWEMDLGNLNYRTGGDVRIKDLNKGLQTVRQELAIRPVVLLCSCREWEGCHRRVIAAAARDRFGVMVRHLAPGDTLGEAP